MCKRILSLLVILMLLCAPAAPAGTVFKTINDALYTIVCRTEEGDQVLGSGVLFLENTWVLTAESCWREGALYALGADGEHAVTGMEKAEDSGAVLLHLATPSAAQPLTLSAYEAETLPYVFGADVQGKSIAAPLYQMRYGAWRGQEIVVLSAEEGLLPGAVAVDEQGAVIALVMSQQAEGLGEYVALSPDNLYNALTDGPYIPLTVTWLQGLLKLTWEDEVRGKGGYVVTLIGDANNYYTSYDVFHEERNVALSIPPGHSYSLQLHYSASGREEAQIDWTCLTTYTIPDLPLNRYAYTQESCLVSGLPGETITEARPAMTVFTADTLLAKDQAVYLQVVNTYDVAEEINAPATVELIAPDGQFFFRGELVFNFNPAQKTGEMSWLDVTDLFLSCAQFSGGTLPQGEYTLRQAIGGYAAGEYTFMVE